MMEEEDLIFWERSVAPGLLVLIGLSTVFDVFEDLSQGSTFGYVVSEVVVATLCLGVAVYLWKRVISSWQGRAFALQNNLSIATHDLERWRESSISLATGLSAAIGKQLDSWCLSVAEKEITFLLIKGLSIREIAGVRETSESTVRQQATTVYRKSGLQGRAQLSAFFLEDLLVSPRGL